jgi:hypothetical protein
LGAYAQRGPLASFLLQPYRWSSSERQLADAGRFARLPDCLPHCLPRRVFSTLVDVQNFQQVIAPQAQVKSAAEFCPLYPQKQTCAVQLGMSALGQKQT